VPSLGRHGHKKGMPKIQNPEEGSFDAGEFKKSTRGIWVDLHNIKKDNERKTLMETPRR